MPDVAWVIDFLKRMEGVIDVFEMDDDLSMRIRDVEHAVASPTGVEVRNEAYDRVMGFDTRICVIYDDNDFSHVRKSGVIEMRSLDGDLVGTEIPPEMIDQYKDRSDIIWISDNFVMFTDKTAGPVRFVVPPLRFYELEDKGLGEVIWSSPSVPSGSILKGSRGYGGRPKTSTMVLGLNLR